MVYREFEPKQPVGMDTNLVSITSQQMLSHSDSWLTQGTDTLVKMVCWGLNSYFYGVMNSTGDELRENLAGREQKLRNFCNTIIKYSSLDYDLQYPVQVEKERTITVEVPKERKAGLFRKETYMEKEERTEKYTAVETVCYKGWLLERLYRIEGTGDRAEILYLDYCLGYDGNIYMLVSKEGVPTEPQVFRCWCFTQEVLNDQHCNVYNAVLGGIIGALDAVSLDPNKPSRNTHLQLDDDYQYNFLVQVEDDEYAFNFTGGTYYRVLGLLTGEEQQRCFDENEWIRAMFA